MSRLTYTLDTEPGPPPIGLIVLQADETLEPELRRTYPNLAHPLYVSRIASQPTVTLDNLELMARDLASAAALLPPFSYPVVGYACTSASAVLGSGRVEALVQQGCSTQTVTNPIRATAARAKTLGVSRFALISPYVEEVNAPLRSAFASLGLETDVFGSFETATEKEVARISAASVIAAATRLGADKNVDAVFLSCTNLRTLDAAPVIEAQLGKPVMSSNAALFWHLKDLALTCGD